MDFISAVQQVADDLEGGAPIDAAFQAASEEFEIPVNALRNRFERAHGDVNTFAARRTAVTAKLVQDVKDTDKRRAAERAAIERGNREFALILVDFMKDWKPRNG